MRRRGETEIGQECQSLEGLATAGAEEMLESPVACARVCVRENS